MQEQIANVAILAFVALKRHCHKPVADGAYHNNHYPKENKRVVTLSLADSFFGDWFYGFLLCHGIV